MMQALRNPAPARRAVYAAFLLPVAVVVLLCCAGAIWGGAVWGGAHVLPIGLSVGVVAVICALLLWFGMPGKVPALVLVLMVWLLGAVQLGRLLAVAGWPVAGLLVQFAIAFSAIVMMARIAFPWGHARAARLSRSGRGIREWEWVYTGERFAMAHPLAARLGWVWAVLAFVLIYGSGPLVAVVLLMDQVSVWQWLIVLVCFAFGVVTAVLLYRRHPAAWVLVWVMLIPTLPFSAPLMVYWADGVRPNLLYRHRFERLVPEEAA